MAPASHQESLRPEDLRLAIIAVLSNADRLAEEARDLGEYGRTQTAFFLSVLEIQATRTVQTRDSI